MIVHGDHKIRKYLPKKHAYPPVQWIPLFFPPVVKRMEHEANHLPRSSGEVKSDWNYISCLPHSFTVCVGALYLSGMSDVRIYREPPRVLILFYFYF